MIKISLIPVYPSGACALRSIAERCCHAGEILCYILIEH